MLDIIRLRLDTLTCLSCGRRVLRQQLAVFKRRNPRPRFNLLDRLFWTAAQQLWSDRRRALIIVVPDTVVEWHRAGFKLYWRILSKVWRPCGGRRRISKEIQDLIFKMVAENPTWGAPRIHDELPMIGFDVSKRTISRWMRKATRNPELAKRWLAFLHNHRERLSPQWISSRFPR